jgi:hypothetical protein
MATSKHSGEQCRNYAMTGSRIHGGATPPWRWRTVTRWDSEQRRVVEKRVRVVKSPEQRERERRAKLDHKIAKYRANRESQWQALGRPRASITPLTINSLSTTLRPCRGCDRSTKRKDVHKNVEVRHAISKAPRFSQQTTGKSDSKPSTA